MRASRPINTLLIANRGEIARRVIRTASGMGIRTVAVYADGDAREPYVLEADEALALGGRTAAETYLDVEKILGAARQTGADAVHPGYGFLSESARFAEAVIGAGLIWVGPPPSAIAAMGDKLRAKQMMSEAGVPILASVELDDGLEADAAELAAMGFPVLVKAAAGGGGKGMRIVTDPAGVSEAVNSARREAEAAFGDGTVFIERYVADSRHVEIQVLADEHGNAVHCFERECSIQRRHQKIVEEAPSPAVDDELRHRMGAAALAAARAVGYVNAGTVEFLLADDGAFFFLEMNTRLQVEHPVTEAITGLDLVREQILVAEGHALAFGQGDLTAVGHAVEVRLYAEDPANDFLPATGTIEVWLPPDEPAVRVDSGVERGSTVGIEFDPMIAKVIAHGATRREAAARLALALERTRIHGVVTNRDLLVAILRHPSFLDGDTTTSFIERVAPALRREPATVEVTTAAVAASLASCHASRAAARVLTSYRPVWRNSVMPAERHTYRHGSGVGGEVVVDIQTRRDGTFDVAIDGGDFAPVRADVLSAEAVQLESGGRRTRLTVHRSGHRVWVHGPAGEVVLTQVDRFPEPEVEAVAGGLHAPMPGAVLRVDVAPGDHVAARQVLVVIEAMKMEHSIVAPVAGVVSEVRVRAGDQVGNGDLLVVLVGEEDS